MTFLLETVYTEWHLIHSNYPLLGISRENTDEMRQRHCQTWETKWDSVITANKRDLNDNKAADCTNNNLSNIVFPLQPTMWPCAVCIVTIFTGPILSIAGYAQQIRAKENMFMSLEHKNQRLQYLVLVSPDAGHGCTPVSCDPPLHPGLLCLVVSRHYQQCKRSSQGHWALFQTDHRLHSMSLTESNLLLPRVTALWNLGLPPRISPTENQPQNTIQCNAWWAFYWSFICLMSTLFQGA